jgi:hypothetical protein
MSHAWHSMLQIVRTGPKSADFLEEISAGIFASSAMSDVLLPRGTQSADFRS